MPNEKALTAITQAMEQAVTAGVFPGGVWAWAHQGEIQPVVAVGTLGQKNPAPVLPATVFDLASLTKPLAAVSVCMKLVENGVLQLDMPVASIMGPFIPADKNKITIAMLLGHTSGYPAWRPYFERLRELLPTKRKQALLKMLLDEPLENTVGEAIVYSDLGYMLLTFVLEALTDKDLARLARDLAYSPLGLNLYYDNPQISLVSDVAQTEDCAWRGAVLQGRVHDDNAWAAGFPLGHAGLFGTAVDVLKLAESMRTSLKAPGGFFNNEIISRFMRKTPNSDKRLGFEAPAETGASCGDFSPKSFGHLGFTGTSFWVDPERDLTAVLLTNRVNLGRENILIRTFRPQIHNLLISFY